MSDELRDLMARETADLWTDLDPQVTWAAGRWRRRARTAATVAGAAAAVVVVAGVAWSLGSSTPAPSDPALPSNPPTMSNTAPVSPDLSPDAVPSGTVQRDQLLPTYDPAEWASLPDYADDLGNWVSPGSAAPLAEDPVDRATVAVQVFVEPGRANLFVRGDDRRWRQVDTEGLELANDDQQERRREIGRGSLSPDGTMLAVPQTGAVVTIDLRTAERTTYPINGLGPAWTGRYASWTSDGEAVLLGRSWAGLGTSAFDDGWQVDLGTEAVSRLTYDPSYAAHLDGGVVIADRWTQAAQHDWVRIGPGDRETQIGEMDPYAVHSEPAGRGDRWVARRELAGTYPDRAWDRGGLVLLDEDGNPSAALPIKGAELNGGGIHVLGWVTDSVVLFAAPQRGTSTVGVVAWNVDTGDLAKGPALLDDSTVAVAGG